ncbi:MAG: MFS transporter [Lacunisphaera sp.]|nr:MFS transporter [Lacunisphaera sp.]
MFIPTLKNDSELYPYRHGLYFAFFNALNWQVATGTTLVLFMAQLGADSFQVGLVCSWAYLLTPVQVLATAFLPHLGYKKLTLAGWGARSLFLLIPLGLALMAPAAPAAWMVYAMVAAMFFYSFSGSMGSAAMLNWLYVLVPAHVRGRYWSTDQMISGTAAVGTLIVSAVLFVVLPPYGAFLVQYLIAIFGAGMAFRMLSQLPDIERPMMMSLEKIVTDTPRLMLMPSPFRTYLWLAVLLFVTTTPILPFSVYYLKATAGLKLSHIMLFTMLHFLGLVGANWFMRSRMDRTGAKPFFLLSFVAYAVVAVGWLVFLHTGSVANLLLPGLFLLIGSASGCWTSANLDYLARLLPEHDRALSLSIHGAASAFLGGFSPVIWGLFLKGGDEVPSVNVLVFEAFFVVVFLSMLLLIVLLPRLGVKTGPVEPLLGGSWLLRPFRVVANLINLAEGPADRREDGPR